MALQFVLGDLSVNKKAALIRQLHDIQQQNPRATLYYLVPEHLKFDMESYMLEVLQQLNGTEHSATFSLQVVSFSRLAWSLLPHYQKGQLPLSKVGLTMLVRRLVQAHRQSLTIYRNQVTYQGFIEKLVSLFEELYMGQVEASQMTEWLQTQDNTEYQQLEQQRLAELSLLYGYFCTAIEEHQLEQFQLYQQLQTFLKEKGKLADHYIVIDHHYYFNAQQMGVVLQLIESFQQVWLTLPMTQEQLQSTRWQPMIETQRKIYTQLLELCQYKQLEVLPNVEVTEAYDGYSPNIVTVAQQYARHYQFGLPKLALPEEEHRHHIWQCDSLQTELRHISNEIHYLVTQKGYRYQDVLIVGRDLDTYHLLVAPIFEQNDIPFFFDHETKMSQHAFVVWLEACLNLKQYNWRYMDILTVMKSNLLQVDDTLTKAEYRHRIDHLENVMLANGYSHYKFTQLSFAWQFGRQEATYQDVEGVETSQTLQDIVVKLRQQFVDTLWTPLNAWKSTFTGTQMANWLYQLVEQTGVKRRLEALRDEAIEQGDLAQSRRHEQVWQVFCQTLEEFHTIYAQQTMDFETFKDVILSGLKEATYHIIPPTLDQVTFTSMDSPQVKPYKVCFVIGVDEKTLPRHIVEQSLLTSDNREHIRQQLLPHQLLANVTQRNSDLELLLVSQLLWHATDYLYVSYVMQSNAHTTKLASPFYQVAQAFNIPIRTVTQDVALSDHVTNHLGKEATWFTPVLSKVRQAYEGGHSLTLDWIQLLQGADQHLWQLVQRAFYFNELPKDLTSETAKALFGMHISASVSKIEQYYQDPYSYFLLYGLKLYERESFKVTPAKTGDYFHEYMDQLWQRMMANNQLLIQLSDRQIAQLCHEVSAELGALPHYQLFDSHPKLQALKSEMDKRLMKFVYFAKMQQQDVTFTPLATEALFGMGQGMFKGWEYDLSSGGKLAIRGKIDRIDQVTQGKLLQVIDYKSGNKTFDLVDFYYGLDMQIMTYLGVALAHYQDYQAVGAFYQPMIHKFQKGTQDMWQEQDDSHAWQTQLSNNRLNGFVAVPFEQLSEWDSGLSTTGKSHVYPVTATKKGTYSSRDTVFTAEELRMLLMYTQHLFKEAGELIHQGKIGLQPYRVEQYTPSLQQAYRVITGFDATEQFNVYREKTLAKKDVFAAIQAIIENKGGKQG